MCLDSINPSKSKEADVRRVFSRTIFVSHIVLNITSGTLNPQMLQF